MALVLAAAVAEAGTASADESATDRVAYEEDESLLVNK